MSSESLHDTQTPPSAAVELVNGQPTGPERRILIADDSELTRMQLQQLLAQEPGLQVDTVSDGHQALNALLSRTYSLVLTDLKMPGVDGLRLIEEVQKRQLPVTIIVTTGFGSVSEAVQAMRLGAYDFLTKPLDLQHLQLILRRALRERTLQDEVAALREQLQNRYAFHNVLSKSPRMHAIFDLVSNVAQTTATVLIEGETGTGKEQIARAIHQASQGRHGPFIAINCAAVPETLLESELFGHEKGAFTSAVSQRPGRFEMAEGGTLFLDEVGDVPAAMQVKLLRVLQERRFERVGGSKSIEVDVRVIAATNRSLRRLVQEGKFREDLYYRLNVVRIELPPLRARPEDIPLLATHFTQKYTRIGEVTKLIAPEAMEVLLGHRWPGNVRELENVIERACVTAGDRVIQKEHLPPEMTTRHKARYPYPIDLEKPLAEVLAAVTAEIEKRYIRRALKKSRGNVGRCAELCGLSRRSITAKLAEYKINKAKYSEP